MPYIQEMTWAQLVGLAERASIDALAELDRWHQFYLKWQGFRAGRTNLDISIALGKTEADIANLDAAFGALEHLHQYAYNGVPSQGDRAFAWRVFS